MVTVPKFDNPTVDPVAPRFTPLSLAGATPDAFGAGSGEALARAGASFEQFSNQMERRAQEFQLQENEAEANEATTNYLIRQSEITERFKQLQGRDPAAAMGQYTTDLKVLRAEMRGGLTNPEVQRLFDRETTRQFGYSVMNASAYAAQQQKVYVNTQQRAVIEASTRATADAADETTLRAGLADIAEKVRNSGDMRGQSPEVVDAEIRAQQGKVWGTWLKDLAEKDPTRARAVLARERKGIDGIVAQNLENVIDQQTLRVVSGQLANGSIAGGVTDTRQQRVDYAMSVLTSKFGKAAAAGLVGGADFGESGMNPLALNKGDGADGSDSIGFAQWNSARAKNLRRFAEERGASPGDFRTQVAFMVHELETTHKGVGDQLRGIADPVAAARIATGQYEVAGGTRRGDPSGVPSQPGRERRAVELNNGVVSPITQLGTSPGQRGTLEAEVRKAANAYAQANGLSERMRADLETQSVSKLDGLYSKQMQVLADSQRSNRNSLIDFVNGGEDGKGGATSLDEITGPGAPTAVRDAWYEADAQLKQTIMDRVRRNNTAKLTPSAPTPETIGNRRRLEQLAIDDPDEFMKVDPLSAGPLTRSDIAFVTRRQSAIQTGQVKGDDIATSKGRVDSAVSVMRSNGLLDVHGLQKEDVDRGSPEMAQLRGALVQALDKFNLNNQGKAPNEKELLEIGKQIVREEVTSGWFGTSFGAGTKKVFDPKAAPKEIVAYDDIPDAARGRLLDKFRERNIPPTRQNYRIWYQKLLDSKTVGAQ